MMQHIGAIGAGNMGGALVRAAWRSGLAQRLTVADRNEELARALAAELGQTTGDSETVGRTCDLIFLGVKPQVMPAVLAQLAPVLAQRTDRFVLMTMAAGLSCRRIQEMAGGDYPVIRVMPNMPANVGAGVLLYCGLGATEEELDQYARLMAPAGLVDRIDESLIDAASCVSGCGPAFTYLFIEALADGGVACGLPRDKALKYAAQMVAGSARMVLETGEHPGRLKDQVCSPGGTTIQGVRALEAGGLRAAAIEAVIAAYDKTMELK